jgi:hypothetical protein
VYITASLFLSPSILHVFKHIKPHKMAYSSDANVVS